MVSQMRLALALGLLAAILGLGWYATNLRAQNARYKLEITNLQTAKKITKREQENTDRIEIELNTYREKNTKSAVGVSNALANRLRDTCKPVTAVAGAASVATPETASDRQSAGAEPSDQLAVESAVTLDYVALASVCAASAQESNQYRAEVRAWQEWYADLKASRDRSN